MIDDGYIMKNQYTIDRQINPQYAESPDEEDGDEYKKWENQPSMVAKRNARERTRVHTVNQAFVILKHHLPSLRSHTKRVSKLKILRAAINYIDALVDVLKKSEPTRTIHPTIQPSFTTTHIVTADESLVSSSLPYMRTLLDYPSYICPPTHQTFILNPPFIFQPTQQITHSST